jgi:hypothetical protein
MLVGALIICIGGLAGYFLPRISRVLGWIVIIAAIPGGVATHYVLIRGYFRCGEFMAGVCSLSAIVLGVIMAVVIVAFGLGMVLGPVLAASRKRKAFSADV